MTSDQAERLLTELHDRRTTMMPSVDFIRVRANHLHAIGRQDLLVLPTPRCSVEDDADESEEVELTGTAYLDYLAENESA